MSTNPPISATPSAATILKAPGAKPRLILIVAGVLIIFCFFLPQFYISVDLKDPALRAMARAGGEKSGEWHLLWGWSTWWGIVSLIFTVFATAAAAGDLFVAAMPPARMVLRFVYTGIYALLSFTTFLGFALALLGVGLGFPDLPSEVRESLSFIRFPLMAFPLLLLTLACLAVSGMILVKELRKPPAAPSPAAA